MVTKEELIQARKELIQQTSLYERWIEENKAKLRVIDDKIKEGY